MKRNIGESPLQWVRRTSKYSKYEGYNPSTRRLSDVRVKAGLDNNIGATSIGHNFKNLPQWN